MLRRMFRIIALGILIAWVVSSRSPTAQAGAPTPEPGPDTGSSGPAPDELVAGGIDKDWQVYRHAATGQLRYLASQSGASIPQPAWLPAGAAPETAALAFLDVYGPLFGIEKASQDLSVSRVSLADGGRSYVRFQQTYQGLPVLGGELVVQLDSHNDIQAVIGEASPGLALDIQPRLDAAAARTAALQALAKWYAASESDFQASPPQLVIYDPRLLDSQSASGASLVWRMQVTGLRRPDVRELVLVDARLGIVSLHFNQVDGAKNRLIYDNNNDYTLGLPGSGPVRLEGGGATGIADVDRSYDAFGATYYYYNSRYGRDGIDNRGMTMAATVRYCPDETHCPYANAFWNSSQMVFGAGYASADDVVGHELTHGVTEHESNLLYYMQSGAINESFSDVWGELVDLSFDSSYDNDTPGVRWLIGEDLPGGALRSMSSPGLYGDPDRVGSANYYCGAGDNGGVHFNSGVGNKAFSLVADGGTFNGFTITAIGLEKAGRVWYEAQTNLLTSAADYQDLAVVLGQACTNLHSLGVVTDGDCAQVREAAAATEMTRQPTSCATSHAPLCNNYVFNSQFNGNDGGWASVGPGAWYVSSQYLYTYGLDNTFVSAKKASFVIGDFDYQVSMRRLGSNTNSSGLLVRGKPLPLGAGSRWSQAYGFLYNRNGNFAIYRYDRGVAKTLVDWTYSEAIYQGNAFNTLRLVARGQRFEFYINNLLVWSGSDGSYSAGDVGVTMYKSSGSTGDELDVDWATLSGGSPVYIFRDNLEDPSIMWWIKGALSGNAAWYYPQSGNPLDYDGQDATSGIYNFWGYDQASTADVYMRTNPSVSLPAGKTAYLHFNHTYQFEASGTNNYDGGVIEYSTDGGTVWQDAGALIDYNGYGAVPIKAGSSNPLAGRYGFVGASQGPISSRLNLNSLAGQSIKFRFRIGTDNSVAGFGWFIDDVGLYTCQAQTYQTSAPFLIKSYPSARLDFHSPFSGSGPGWSVNSGDWWVDPSHLVTTGLMNYVASASYYGLYDNFAIEARMKRVGCIMCANRLILRGTPNPLGAYNNWNNAYAFQYTMNGSISVYKWVSGVETPLQSWILSLAVIPGEAWNWLRVYVSGSTMKFFVNGQLAWEGTDTSLASGQVGVGMYTMSGWDQLDVDWVTLWRVTSPVEAEMGAVAPPPAQVPIPGGDSNQSP